MTDRETARVDDGRGRSGSKGAQLGEPCRQGIARLGRLLAEQVDLCGRLERAGASQAEFIRAGDTDGLLCVLEDRQRLIDRMSAVGLEIEPFRKRWDEVLGGADERSRRGIAEMVEQVRGAIERIGRQDDHDRTMLQRARDVAAGELATIANKRSAVAAYGGGGVGSSGAGARYQDREG